MSAKKIETPVINKKQKAKTLSFKTKQKKVKTVPVREVFALPNERYWPVLDQEKDIELADLLKSSLVPAKIPCEPKAKIPWSTLAKLSRQERKELRASNSPQLNTAWKDARSALVIGINSVTRALEKNETSVVVVANDIDPPIIGNHLSDLCVVKRVPLIVMQTLRSATKEGLGFSCIAVGIKCETPHFKELREKLIEVSSSFPMPDGPQFQKVTKEYYDEECSIPDQPPKVKPEKWDPSRLNDIYLYRIPGKGRVFIPPPRICLAEQQSTGVLKIDGDFISLGINDQSEPDSPPATVAQETEVYRHNNPLGMDEDDSPVDAVTETPSKKRKISHYKPLIVKSVQSNPNKKKKQKRKKSM